MRALPVAVACLLAGCGSATAVQHSDGDAAVVDGGALDASAFDAGRPDASADDAGAVDAGSVDAGVFDAGSFDAGSLDAGALDAGTPDAGSPDAGTPDAGTVTPSFCDAGLVDSLPYFVAAAFDTLPNAPSYNVGGSTTYRLGVNAAGGAPDPTKLPARFDRPGVRYYALTKFNDPSYFELYAADAQRVSILFEVSTGNYSEYARLGGPNYHAYAWRPNIRRFSSNPDDVTSGLEVLPRCIAPGQLYSVNGIDQQRFQWDDVTQGGRWLETESVGPGGVDVSAYESLHGATGLSVTALDGRTVAVTDALVKHSYWHDTGAIAEDYVFARDLGLVGWAWFERMADDSGQYAPRVVLDAATMQYVYTCLDGTSTVRIAAADWATQAQVTQLSATLRRAGEAPRTVTLRKVRNPRVYTFFPNYPLPLVWYATCNQGGPVTQRAPANLANLNLDPRVSGPGHAPTFPQVVDLPFDAPTQAHLEGPFVSVSTSNNLVWTAAVPFFEETVNPAMPSAPVVYTPVPAALEYCVKYAPQGTPLSSANCIVVPRTWYTLPSGLAPGAYQWSVMVVGARTPRTTGGTFTIAP